MHLNMDEEAFLHTWSDILDRWARQEGSMDQFISNY